MDGCRGANCSAVPSSRSRAASDGAADSARRARTRRRRRRSAAEIDLGAIAGFPSADLFEASE